MREEVRRSPTASMHSILTCFIAPADSAEAAAKHSHTFDIFKKRSQRKSTEGGRSGVPLLRRTSRKRTLWCLTKLHKGSLEVPACFQPFDTSKQLQSGIAVLKLILHSDKVDQGEKQQNGFQNGEYTRCFYSHLLLPTPQFRRQRIGSNWGQLPPAMGRKAPLLLWSCLLSSSTEYRCGSFRRPNNQSSAREERIPPAFWHSFEPLKYIFLYAQNLKF
jgi:hypothetical protein